MVRRLTQGALLLPGIQNQPRENPRHFLSKLVLGSRSQGAQTGCLLGLTCSATAQAKAAVAQVRRRKWKYSYRDFSAGLPVTLGISQLVNGICLSA
jgi:hypothetical protein